MERKKRKATEGIFIELRMDVSKSHYKWNSENIQGMVKKLPISGCILPEYLPFVMDALQVAIRMYEERNNEEREAYDKLYRDAFNKQK